jgi:hypothetical protein
LVDSCEQAWSTDVPVRWGARPYRDKEMFTPWHIHPEIPGFTADVALSDGLRQLFTNEES